MLNLLSDCCCVGILWFKYCLVEYRHVVIAERERALLYRFMYGFILFLKQELAVVNVNTLLQAGQILTPYVPVVSFLQSRKSL